MNKQKKLWLDQIDTQMFIRKQLMKKAKDNNTMKLHMNRYVWLDKIKTYVVDQPYVPPVKVILQP